MTGQSAEIEGIPEDRPCYRCGKNPAEGYASVWTAADGERWFCHGDDDESPTCYENGSSLSVDEANVILDLFLDEHDHRIPPAEETSHG